MPEQEWSIGRLRGGLALVYYRDGKRKRHTLGTSSPSEAQRIAPALYTELTRPKGTTVAELWNAYTAAKAGRAVVGTMKHTWKALEDRFGPLEGETITTEHCRAHIEARRKAGIQDGTIHTELGHLRMVLVWAVKQNHIGKAVHIERPPKPKPPEKHLTRKQVLALLRATDAPHIRLFIHLGYATAGRKAAILGLTWDRVDFERGKINLKDPKLTTPHKGRAIVPMTRTLRAALQDARQGALTAYVVEWGGERVASVKKGLATASAKAGLPKVSHHMLRHSAAVRMAEDGVPMEEIASYLGHSNVKVTRDIYARFSPDHLRNAAESLELDELVHVNQRARAG
jgi:integrase